MKQLIFLFIMMSSLLIVHPQSFSQPLPQYQLTIQNPILIGNVYQFDIYIKRIGATNFRIGNSQFIMAFNTGNFESPILTRVISSEEIGAGFFFDQVIVSNELRISLGGNGVFANAIDVSNSGVGTRISSFRISGVNVPVVSAGLTWINLPTLIRTGVSEINTSDNYRDITDLTGASHINGGGEFARISGFKFNDLNGNSSWELSTEPALNDWTITLTGPNGPYVAVTGASPWDVGYYEFVNLTPGNYNITEIILNNWSQTVWPINPIIITAGQNSQNNNFGNYNGPAVLGLKFNDVNGDSMKGNDEPGIAGWEIVATKVGGGGVKTKITNGDGYYIFIFVPSESGLWEISETSQGGWVQTYPTLPSTYTINIQSGTYAIGKDFGNFSPSSISGMKFRDENGDSLKSDGEPGISGWRIDLLKDALPFKSEFTDGNGNYQFTGLVPGTYTIKEELPLGWIQTMPTYTGEYIIVISVGGTNIVAKDFGNFQPGSISGISYYDKNHNGEQDPGEIGMAGIQINAEVQSGNLQVFSGIGGVWSFSNLIAGTSTITEQIPSGYHLTEPPSEKYIIPITSGTNITGLKFGNSAASDTSTFRTISYDSLVYAIDTKGKLTTAIKKKPDKVKFECIIPNNTGSSVTTLHLHFSIPIIFGNDKYPFIITPSPAEVNLVLSRNIANIIWADSIHNGDSVVIKCWGSQGHRVRIIYSWTTYPCGGVHGEPIFIMNELQYPMPNTMNVAQDIFLRNGFGSLGLVVGVARVDTPKKYGWVRILSLSNLKKSLIDRSLVHKINARPFNIFNNSRPFVKEQKKLSPKKQDNRFFANVLALKINIVASDLEILPQGLGDLIYDDGVNPLSGLTVRQIVVEADTALTVWRGRSSSELMNLDTTISKINTAFEGPIDTLSFFTELKLTGVKRLIEVPFLRANPNAVPTTRPLDVNRSDQLVDGFELSQNYPNPFNPTTTIEFELPNLSVVTVKVYNVLGQEVFTLCENEIMDEGLYDLEFDATDFASGVYFYRLAAKPIVDDEEGIAGEIFTSIKKMILIK